MSENELRKKVARIISPKTPFEDIEGVRLSQWQLDRRRVAYKKADAVIAEIIGAKSDPQEKQPMQIIDNKD